jgi:hypothetical protein
MFDSQEKSEECFNCANGYTPTPMRRSVYLRDTGSGGDAGGPGMLTGVATSAPELCSGFEQRPWA